ncbi:1-phosphatidylinositol 4,5-bisphosphate phosphodiesterase delta-4 isoform X2 [Carettochelys insculpta]|uniref:1-phosphatidylinositol 4,5-bisphosphate phosphodiesterase delta-4 isoform X2 n=1 Tax=Carettochelys insculpta TaxID=44489 RepID=UPI003EBCF62F
MPDDSTMASPLCSSGLQQDETLKRMQQETLMWKVKAKSWKKQRYFTLQDNCMAVWHRSKTTGKAKYSFSISDVETVREGHQSETLQSLAEEFPPECCFTVVFHGRHGNLDLVAGSPEEAHCWVWGLRRLVELVTSMDQQEKMDQWICDWFQKADKNKDGCMSFKEVWQLLKMMNVDMNKDHALQLFQLADRSGSGTLEGEEFVLFYKALTHREDVWEIFEAFSADGKKLTLLEFVDFLRQEQLEVENTEELAMELITRFEPSETAQACHMLTFDGFLRYLLSPEGAIFNPAHGLLYQDMSQPLCHYFISSSHNTYLVADQVQGQSSIEGYIRALKRGCRCVEVDCWDDPSGEPVVYHGHTFTSKIPFKEVVATLGQYAFQGLRGKVIVKGKRAESWARSPSTQQDEAMETAALEDVDALEAESLRHEDQGEAEKSQASTLDDYVVYCRSVPFRGFQEALARCQPDEMASLPEDSARKLIQEAGNEFVRHTAWQLTRIYPRGLRLDSSNYNPQEMWNVGCQLVAMNVQTAGLEMDLCDGLFRQNGRCGYVLKPAFLRDEGAAFDPQDPQSWAGGSLWSLAVQVISGQQLPKVASSKASAIVDPLVRVEIHGVPADQAKQETAYVANNGFNPSWRQTLQFQVHVPELALVRFVVEDYDRMSRNDFVGQFTLPFCSIRAGYRHVHLLSRDGTAMSPSSLFVHVRIMELPRPD